MHLGEEELGKEDKFKLRPRQCKCKKIEQKDKLEYISVKNLLHMVTNKRKERKEEEMRDEVSKFCRQDARIMSLVWLQTNDSEEGKEGSGETREKVLKFTRETN